ncbi:MAG: non-homologous end-joining DNA ligase [Actinomycetota bacterium]
MTDPFDVLDDDDRRKLRRKRQPRWIEPMKATLAKEAFSDPEWIFEPKLDGERCLAFVKSSEVRLLSRNQKSTNSSYPEIVEALGAQRIEDAVLDGEIVAFAGDAPSFSALQRRMHVIDPDKARRTGVKVGYHVFDILHFDGYDLSNVPLLSRKKLLRKAVRFRVPLKFVQHRAREGEAYFKEMCARPGWEGVVAKRANGAYVHSRSRDWLKFKCSNEQEFVIGGFTDPQGSRVGFGALLVGYYDDGELRYAGKVGTGYDTALLRELRSDLDKREIEEPPFFDRGASRRAAHWVRPELVAQVGFSEWTGDGRLRHPRFLGLRRDKDARSVVRERPT